MAGSAVQLPKVSTGFNLDSLAGREDLIREYDQVQITNGGQKLILQRNAGNVQTQTVLASNGLLKAVPAVGDLTKAISAQQVTTAKAKAASAPAWEKYLPWAGGAVALGAIVWLIVRK